MSPASRSIAHFLGGLARKSPNCLFTTKKMGQAPPTDAPLGRGLCLAFLDPRGLCVGLGIGFDNEWFAFGVPLQTTKK